VLDDKDQEFIDTLRSLNVPKNVAAVITYLANVNEATSREIEMGTNLRQPEVSIAMRSMHQNDWVDEREVKGEGKGRPMKVYKLAVSIDKIIQHYEEEMNREAAKTMQAIKRLKEITAT
jgi:predicted transcriptional regulator